jgi:hypothetical protein
MSWKMALCDAAHGGLRLLTYSHNKGMDHSSLFQIPLPAQLGIIEKILV